MGQVVVFEWVRRVLLWVGLVFVALPVGSALANTILIGEAGGGIGCGPNVVWAQTDYVVPSGGGTIFQFGFQSDSRNKGQRLDFLVLRPSGGDNYQVIGKTGLVTLAGAQGGGRVIEIFPAPNFGIGVEGGDILGMWFPPQEGQFDSTANCAHTRTGGLALNNLDVSSDPGVGDTVHFSYRGKDFGLNENVLLRTNTVGEPPPPTSKKQCKHGGWKHFGNRFKNQGQCVRFVKHHHHKHHHHKHHPGG